MTKNHDIFTKLDVPKVYENEYQQELYVTKYREGRELVNRGDNVSIFLLHLLALSEESLRGYLDGIRDELLFQSETGIEEALN